MLILTESNNPFKYEFQPTRALQEMMEESGLKFEMFDEAYSYCGNNNIMYLYAMLYEAEQAYNEIWNSMTQKTMNRILNEGISTLHEEDEKTFWQSIKEFFKKIWTGISNFFKRIWAAIANDRKLFLQASQNVPDDAESKEPEYTAAEEAEAAKIGADLAAKESALDKELETLKNNPSATTEQFNSITERKKALEDEFTKKWEEFNKKVEARRQAENVLNAQQIRSEIQNIASNTAIDQVLKNFEQLSNTTAQSALKDSENGEKSANQAPAAPPSQNQQQNQKKEPAQKSNLSFVVNIKKAATTFYSNVVGKLYSVKDSRGKFARTYATKTDAANMASATNTNVTVNGQTGQNQTPQQ